MPDNRLRLRLRWLPTLGSDERASLKYCGRRASQPRPAFL